MRPEKCRQPSTAKEELMQVIVPTTREARASQRGLPPLTSRTFHQAMIHGMWRFFLTL